MAARIRPFREADAIGLVRWLEELAPAEDVFDERAELRRPWVAVRPDARRQGIGAALWERIEAHATEVGGTKLRRWCAADWPDGQALARARGFAPDRRLLQFVIDPSTLEERELERRAAEATRAGVRVVSLGDLPTTMGTAIRRLFLLAGEGAPGHDPGAVVAASTFDRIILRNPLLDPELSTVVFDHDQPVALCWLKGDRHLGRYAIEFTGTLPAYRGRGLATLAKLSALDRARRAGVHRVGTSNDEDNGPMLAINRRLGHQPLQDLILYTRRLPGPA